MALFWAASAFGQGYSIDTNLATTNWVTPAETVTDNGTNKFIIVNPPAGNRLYRVFKP